MIMKRVLINHTLTQWPQQVEMEGKSSILIQNRKEYTHRRAVKK